MIPSFKFKMYLSVLYLKQGIEEKLSLGDERLKMNKIKINESSWLLSSKRSLAPPPPPLLPAPFQKLTEKWN